MFERYDAVMRVLLAQGLSPNKPPDQYGHLLQIAERGKHEAVTRTLLTPRTDRKILTNDTELIYFTVDPLEEC